MLVIDPASGNTDPRRLAGAGPRDRAASDIKTKIARYPMERRAIPPKQLVRVATAARLQACCLRMIEVGACIGSHKRWDPANRGPVKGEARKAARAFQKKDPQLVAPDAAQ